MDYSQGELLRLMKEGAMPGEAGVPKHIETVISNVFIFDTRVYKIYKNDSDFFNQGFRDISEKAERFSFTQRDFEWNNALSPSIYTKLIGVRVVNNKIFVCPPDEAAEELVFVMNRIDANDVLFEKIMQGKLTADDSFDIGRQLGESLKKIQKKVSGNHNFYNLFEERVKDLRTWIKSVVEHISEEESETYLTFLDMFRVSRRELFEKKLTKEITADGDFHSHNAIFSNGLFHLMDTFPPKDEWGVGHHLIPVYRIGTDIWALSGKKEMFDAFIKGYETGSGNAVDRSLEPLYVMYASGIAVSYLYMLQDTDPTKKVAAERFHAFVRKYFENIKY